MIEPAKGGKLQVDTRSNALVVTERPKRLEKVEEIVGKLDKATEQVMIETKFVEITDQDLRNLGVDWKSLNGYAVGVNPTPTLMSSGEGRNPDDELIRESAQASKTFGAVFDAGEFTVVLNALESQTRTRLVSNPTVVTMNNNEAVISIGEQFPVPNYTYNQERGTFEVSGFEYKDIGIIMRVTPQVNNTGLITLKIDPEVSSRSGTTSFGGAGGAEIPIISTRRTSTQVAIKDGYTMGLGGLIENVSSDGESKVPLLGDIPGLGRLFKSSNKNSNSRNLLVFITAKVLSPDGGTYKDVFQQAVIEQMGLTEADIPGAGVASR
jgi:type IV pilus assembly protein PilQ